MVVDHDIQLPPHLSYLINHKVFLLFATSLSHSILPPLCDIRTEPSRQTCGEGKSGEDEGPFPIL